MAVRSDVDDMIDFLNSILEIDRSTVQSMILTRWECNASLSEHPSIQIRNASGGYIVSILGLLNGYFGTIEEGARLGWGPISVVIEKGQVVRFMRTESI